MFFTVASWEAQRNTCPKSLAALYRLPPIMVPLKLAVSLQFLILTFFPLWGKTHVWLPNLGHHTWWQSTLISPVPTFSFSPLPNTLNLDLDKRSKFTIIKDALKHPRQQYLPTCLSRSPSPQGPKRLPENQLFSDVMF